MSRASFSNSSPNRVGEKRSNGRNRSRKMHVRKATEALELMSDPRNNETFTRAAVLLDGLERDNDHTDPGKRPNETASEKIQRARHWFEVLWESGRSATGRTKASAIS